MDFFARLWTFKPLTNCRIERMYRTV
jgi:hypothetical protein